MTDCLEFKPNLADAVARMKRLWDLQDPLDRIPATISLPSPSSVHPKADGSFFGKLHEYLEHRLISMRHQAQVFDEKMPIVHPQYGHAIISALCGSPIQAASETVWSIPIVRDLAQAAELRMQWDSEWGNRFREDYDRLLAWSKGRCGVANYEVEGVADTMSALRGATELCTDCYEHPNFVDSFAERVTDLLIEFGRWNNDTIGAAQDIMGGVTDCWSIWMPRNSIATTEDASVMLSNDTYRRFIQPRDHRLTGAFTRALMEVHAEGNHQIAPFGEVEGVSMMTIQNPLKMRPDHRDAVRRLLGRKIFWISCKSAEMDDLLNFTGVRGIMVGVSAPDVTAARRQLDDLCRMTEKHRRA
jgi:hypothetical protein